MHAAVGLRERRTTEGLQQERPYRAQQQLAAASVAITAGSPEDGHHPRTPC